MEKRILFIVFAIVLLTLFFSVTPATASPQGLSLSEIQNKNGIYIKKGDRFNVLYQYNYGYDLIGYTHIDGVELVDNPSLKDQHYFKAETRHSSVYSWLLIGNEYSSGYSAVRFNLTGIMKISSPFDSASDWSRESIVSAVNKGYVPADLQNNYTNITTRAEFCVMAVKWLEYATEKNIDMILAEKGLTLDTSAFSDTNDPYILAAYALCITNGTTSPTDTAPGTFTPNGQFSREQAATMVMNTIRAYGADVSYCPNAGYADIGDASSWAVDSINFCYANGIMNGTNTSPLTFSPKAVYTREQSIVTFNNIKPNSFDLVFDVVHEWIEPYKQFIYNNYTALDTGNGSSQIESMSLHDINGDGIPELFLGYWRVAMVYTYKNNEVVNIGDIYNFPIYKIPGYRGIYTYGGQGTGVASSCLYEMIDDEIIDNFDGEIYIYYQFSGMIEEPPEAGYYTHDTKITEEEYYFLIEEYFNKNNQIPVYVIDNITTNINNMFIDYLNLQ